MWRLLASETSFFQPLHWQGIYKTVTGYTRYGTVIYISLRGGDHTHLNHWQIQSALLMSSTSRSSTRVGQKIKLVPIIYSIFFVNWPQVFDTNMHWVCRTKVKQVHLHYEGTFFFLFAKFASFPKIFWTPLLSREIMMLPYIDAFNTYIVMTCAWNTHRYHIQLLSYVAVHLVIATFGQPKLSFRKWSNFLFLWSKCLFLGRAQERFTKLTKIRHYSSFARAWFRPSLLYNFIQFVTPCDVWPTWRNFSSSN